MNREKQRQRKLVKRCILSETKIIYVECVSYLYGRVKGEVVSDTERGRERKIEGGRQSKKVFSCAAPFL